MEAFLIFPNSLFSSQIRQQSSQYIVVEHPVYFKRYKFNKLRIMFNRVTMKKYAASLPSNTIYLDCHRFDNSSLEQLLAPLNIKKLSYYDTTDHELEQELGQLAAKPIRLETPSFLASRKVLDDEKPSNKSQASFYSWQRTRLKILLTPTGQPEGGKWSLDADNRKKLPAGLAEKLSYPSCEQDAAIKEGIEYTERYFASNPGSMSNYNHLMFDRSAALECLQIFLDERLVHFGDYEDFTSQANQFLYHAIISPYLNNGLLTPQEVIDAALKVPVELNNIEGFVRQVIGWREYMRYLYLVDNDRLVQNNPFNSTRLLTEQWYDGTTGLFPVDEAIKDAFAFGYLHHIRRLMFVGQMMLLCQIAPDEIMRWFSEFACDSYDWVMVGNIYGMIGFDKQMISKPYISSSNYVLKNSNYSKDGKWDVIWTSLYYAFLHRNQEVIKGRGSLLLANYKKLSEEALSTHLDTADRFIQSVSTD